MRINYSTFEGLPPYLSRKQIGELLAPLKKEKIDRLLCYYEDEGLPRKRITGCAKSYVYPTAVFVEWMYSLFNGRHYSTNWKTIREHRQDAAKGA